MQLNNWIITSHLQIAGRPPPIPERFSDTKNLLYNLKRKLLKYRDTAKQFHRVEVKNGETTSFWYDIWSDFWCLKEKLGERGFIDLGIPISSSVRDAMVMNRRRQHRQEILNLVEEEIKKQRVWHPRETRNWCGFVEKEKPELS